MKSAKLAQALWVAVCLSLSSTEAARSQNPNGFIQGDQWACLLPLLGNDCTGGGPHTMLANWVAPRNVTTESPFVGTPWGNIDFGVDGGGAAKSGGYRGAVDAGGRPVFVNIGLGADPDIVDFQAYLQREGYTDDFVMAIAATYVLNNTGGPLDVGVCTSSDDSLQVWVNNSLILNLSECRCLGTGCDSFCQCQITDCSETSPAILAPGVNRITVLQWTGARDFFAFKLGLQRPDGSRYTQFNPEVTFLGAQNAGVVPPSPVLARSHPGSDFLCPGVSHKVTLRRVSGPSFTQNGTYRVTEELRGPGFGFSSVPTVSDNGSITSLPFEPGLQIVWHNVQGSVLNGAGLSYTVEMFDQRIIKVSGTAASDTGAPQASETSGPRELAFLAPDRPSTGAVGVFQSSHDIGAARTCAQGSFTGAGGTFTMTASGAGMLSGGDQFHFAYQRVSGDFAVQARFFDVQDPTGQYGLMARWDCNPASPFFFVHNQGSPDFTCGLLGPRSSARPGADSDNVPGDDPDERVVFPSFLRWQDVFVSEPLAASCVPGPDPDPRNDVRGDSRNLPQWLRLVRRGSTFYGYASDDGATWRTLGAYGWFEAPETLLVGVAGASQVDCSLQTVSFDNYSRAAPPPVVPELPEVNRFKTLAQFSFDDDPEGQCPARWICNSFNFQTGAVGFKPQVVNDRLRMSSALTADESTATWAFYEEPIDTDGLYLFEFDAFFHYRSRVPSQGPDFDRPGDGLTFCVLGTDINLDDLSLRRPSSGSGLGFHRINFSSDERALRSRDVSLNSFAVELDNWYSGHFLNDGDGSNGSGWDPNGGEFGTGTGLYHVALDVNASVFSGQRNLHRAVHDEDLPDIYHPAGIHVRVLYDHGNVKVWVRSNAAGAGGGLAEFPGESKVIDENIDPLTFTTEKAFVGFTAGTGSATVESEVDNVLALVPDEGEFFRGDPNIDGKTDLSDAVTILHYLFSSNAEIKREVDGCRASADCNASQEVDISDAVFLLSYLFQGGSAPPLPGPGSGFGPPRECSPYRWAITDGLDCFENQPCRQPR